MTRIIVVTSGKGGVGKTTVTANLGMTLAKMGHRVALVDGDFGLRNLDLLLGLENRVVYTAVEVLAGECRLDQALVRDKRQPGLVLLPATQNRKAEMITPNHMKWMIGELAPQFDFVLIDSPAGIEMGFKNAIAAAQEALIVTTPEISAVRDADRVIGLLEASNITPARLIVNRLRPAMVEASEMMSVEDVSEILAVQLIGVVPEDERVITSTNRGEPLVLESNSGSRAALAFENIAHRLCGEKTPYLDLNVDRDNLFKRLRKIFAK
ncbi:septum site-determining protein MinD [Chamaesiphon minutus]|uniref:Septum site-determining protein MinD n=1 Tax=Chamaesiphon minutus (strain ATCC 27169 / PCC 6605) TaxID=1173020 RepID=K9UM63_CHAP6|nr:septum site-determining protein MinD [Chamaesiphon minutus]AFY95748.1 septum site-determining protein MinD [Chamaesiphon minutus PCC 6605]